MRKATAIILSIALCLFMLTSYAPAPKSTIATNSIAPRVKVTASDVNPMQSVSYMKLFPDGDYQMMNEDELLREAEAYTAGIRRLIRIERGEVGYMKITLTAERTDPIPGCYDERNAYFIISANVEWIVKPSWAEETIVTLSWSRGASHEPDYTDVVSLSEHFSCDKCSRFEENFYHETKSKDGKAYNCEEAQKHVELDYHAKVTARFKPSTTHRTCIHELLGIGVQERTAFSVYTHVYSQEWDFNAYVSISNRISSSAFKIFPSYSITLTFGPSKEEFTCRPITVPYLAKP